MGEALVLERENVYGDTEREGDLEIDLGERIDLFTQWV